MALDERNSISKFDPFPWFSACTRTCEKFRIWVIFGMKLKVVLRVDWCRNPVTTVWTKEIQFRKFDPLDFRPVRGWIQDLGDFRDEAQSSPQSRLMSIVTTVLVDPLAWLWTKEIIRNFPFPWFSACTWTCEKFRIWVILGMKLKVVLRVDWCRNPVTTVLVDPLAWLWTKEIQFRNLTHFLDFSACTRTCKKFRIWMIFGMKLKVVLRVDWCRNPVTTVLVDPLAWLKTKEIQFRNLTHFLDFRPVRGPAKNSGFGWFSGWSSK